MRRPLQQQIERERGDTTARRNVRPRDVRSATIPIREGRRLPVLPVIYPEGVERPRTRADCLPGGDNSARPCPWVSCKHNLYLDAIAKPRDLRAGVFTRPPSVKLNYPDLEPDALTYSCALDVADRGGLTLEDVSLVMNLTRERVRQIQDKGLERIRSRAPAQLLELQPEGLPPTARGTLPAHRWRGKSQAITEGPLEGAPSESGISVSEAALDAGPPDEEESLGAVWGRREWSAADDAAAAHRAFRAYCRDRGLPAPRGWRPPQL